MFSNSVINANFVLHIQHNLVLNNTFYSILCVEYIFRPFENNLCMKSSNIIGF